MCHVLAQGGVILVGMQPAPPPFPRLPAATTLDEVVDAIQSVIDWSIGAASRLGYFAALYKRITLAVGVAVAERHFEDGARLERLDAGSRTATSTR